MTKKDFELIATVVRGIESKAIRHTVAVAFADKLETENRKFNRDRFLLACDPAFNRFGKAVEL